MEGDKNGFPLDLLSDGSKQTHLKNTVTETNEGVNDPLFLEAARTIVESKKKKSETQEKKSPFSFKHLLDFLKSDDDEEEDNDD